MAPSRGAHTGRGGRSPRPVRRERRVALRDESSSDADGVGLVGDYGAAGGIAGGAVGAAGLPLI